MVLAVLIGRKTQASIGIQSLKSNICPGTIWHTKIQSKAALDNDSISDKSDSK